MFDISQLLRNIQVASKDTDYLKGAYCIKEMKNMSPAFFLILNKCKKITCLGLIEIPKQSHTKWDK